MGAVGIVGCVCVVVASDIGMSVGGDSESSKESVVMNGGGGACTGDGGAG